MKRTGIESGINRWHIDKSFEQQYVSTSFTGRVRIQMRKEIEWYGIRVEVFNKSEIYSRNRDTKCKCKIIPKGTQV